MAWARIDDQFTDHPKAAEAGPLGIALQVAGLCYCNRHLTDGFISRAVAARLLDFTGIAEDLDADKTDTQVMGFKINWQYVAGRLVDAGMWEPVEGGWVIHDYLDYNPSRADTLAKRQADLARKRNLPQPDGDSARNPHGIHTDSKRPVPSPIPVPQEEIKTEVHAEERERPPNARAREDFSPSSPNLSPQIADALASELGTTTEKVMVILPHWADRRPHDRPAPSNGWLVDFRAFCRSYLEKEPSARGSPNSRAAPVNFAQESVTSSLSAVKTAVRAKEEYDRGHGEVRAGDVGVDRSLSARVQAHPGNGGHVAEVPRRAGR